MSRFSRCGVAVANTNGLVVDVLAVHEIGRRLVAEGASGEVMGRYRAWRDEVLASAQVLEVVPQDLCCGVRSADIVSSVGEFDGHERGLRLVASGEAHAAAKDPHLSYHVAEVGAGF